MTETKNEKQESLTEARLKLFKPEYPAVYEDRPKANLLDLMNWSKVKFGQYIEPDVCKVGDLQSFIHNKIVIDGAFLEFSEQTGVKVECVYRDSVASWRVEKKYEHFMAQEVFKITYKDFSFIHCALWHKGNQNEDEVSFFILVSDDNFYKYLELRNSYDDWIVKRDRANNEVRVIGGEGYSYDKDITWDDIYLPSKLKSNIRMSIECFLKAEKMYKDNKIPWKTGILLWGPVGTGKTSLIKTIIANYDFKPVTITTSSHCNDDTVTEAFEYAQEQAPGLLFIEDLDTLIGQNVKLSHFLNLLYGVQLRNGICVIATCNNAERLSVAIADRPSRFDQKFEIPSPTKAMAKEYLNKWFGDLITAEEYEKLSKKAVEHKFSYAHLKDLYIRSAYQAIADHREKPNKEDIKIAMADLLFDKKQAETGFVSENSDKIGIGDSE